MKYEDMKPHQQRVVVEKQELDAKCEKLDLFTGSETFKSLPTAEQGRLTMQLRTMELYSEILKQRIEAFE